MIKLKKYVAYDPITYQFMGFYNEGRKDIPDTIDEVNVDTFMEDIGQHNKYNPVTKLFYTDQAELDANEEATNIRKRNIRLSATDKYMLIDFPITGTEKREMKAYRQALRDFPETGIIPDEPDFFKG